jgi:hypothetical protein
MIQLLINQYIGAISNVSKPDFIVIDESLDCIDTVRFYQKLPEIISLMRAQYQTILLISHREVPSYLINKNILIKYDDEKKSSIILK